MKKLTLTLVSALFCTFVNAQQEGVTNAFLDLQRQGAYNAESSVMQEFASAEQLRKLLSEKPSQNYFVFAEERSNDVRRKDSVPVVWTQRAAKLRNVLNTVCAPNEYLTYQVALYTPFQNLDNVKLKFSDLRAKGSQVAIKSDRITCFNMGGIGVNGQNFSKVVNVGKGEIQPLWIGVDVPQDAKGVYSGTVTITPGNAPSQIVRVELKVEGDAVVNKGDNEGWRKGRLRWLNSTIGSGDQPTAPYVALKIKDKEIKYLGGSFKISEGGLPEAVVTKYNESNTLDESVKNNILAGKVSFIIETEKGIEKLQPVQHVLLKETASEVVWKNVSSNKDFELIVTGSFNFDGFVHYSCRVRSLSDKKVRDIRMEVPYAKESAKYMMGLGCKGGYRTEKTINWKWDVSKHQDKIWMGAVNSGLNFAFMDESYVRPLVNVYYDLGKLSLPRSWGNESKGGINVVESDNNVLLTAYSGERDIKKGDILFYDFNMLITPVKPLNMSQHAQVRFYHSNSDLSNTYIPEALKNGATAVNVHHKKDIYPFINYPYYDESIGDLKNFFEQAHSKNLKGRLYYTTRELTVKIPELWALRSLGGEVIHDGPGKDARTLIHQNGPHAWLNENLTTNFIPAWYNAFNEGKYKGDMDLSVITTPDSRWNNYYLEGLDWMVKNLGLDGVYIDDSALDRLTLQRARRVLDGDGKERLIDIHSWNHNNQWAGFANSLHIYLELLPYVDRTWIGEGFGAENSEDFWLVEMSGIPFGLLSESLDAHGSMRGMAYGMLPRLPWSGNPVSMWKVWDDFSMKDAQIIGYWDSRNAVVCESPQVRSTLYHNPKTGKTMVALTNWSDTEQSAKFTVKGREISPDAITSPAIENVQDGTYPETIKPASGVIFVVDNLL